jgi:hypothetical protein
MESQMNPPMQKEIQVYKNEFFSGIVQLARKLFMF